MKSVRRLWIGVGLLLLGALGAALLAGSALADCSTTFPNTVYVTDADLDGHNDSAFLSAGVWNTGLSTQAFTINLSILDNLFYFPIATSSADYSVAAGASVAINMIATLPDDWSEADYTVVVEYDDYSAPCYDYPTLHLSPVGRYQPSVSSPSANLTGDEGSTVNFTLLVSTSSNYPDLVEVLSTPGNWTFDISATSLPLNDSENTTITVSVHIPHNAPPLSNDLMGIYVRGRNHQNGQWIFLSTAVNAQTFGVRANGTADTRSAPINGALNLTVNVTNLGNNRDTFTLSAGAAPAGWAIDGFPASVSVDAGWTFVFNVTVHFPPGLTGALTFDPTITALAGDNTTAATVALHAAVFLPDFVVGPSDISLDASSPKAGDTVVVHVTVRNTGYIIALEAVVRLFDGSHNLTQTVSVGLLGSGVATFEWPATAGHITLEATADSTNTIPEGSEANNHASVEVTVNGPPTAATPTPTASGEVGASVNLSAAGSADADGTVAEYYFDFGDGNNSGWVSTSTITHAYGAPGNYTVRVRVRDNSGLESQNATSTVSVRALAAPPPGSAGGGDVTPILLLVVVAAAVGALVMLMMRSRKGKPATPPEAPAAPPAEPPKAP